MSLTVFDTWAIPSLAEAPGFLAARFEDLDKNNTGCCIMCGQCMTHPTLMCFDIPQAYEEIKHEWLIKDVAYILKHSEKAGRGLKQVILGTRAIVGEARSLYRNHDDRIVISTRTIMKA
eukprot:3328175-Karenia_brevis.AAC.1